MGTVYPWQQLQWQALNQQLQMGRLPQALLLYGSSGMGKVDFAHAFAEKILCENESKGDEMACGNCRGCRLFRACTHPDCFQVTLQEKSKIIKVDQIRELIASLTQTAKRGGHQVALIYPADQMNRAAYNALLKTLEEPAGAVLLILVCNQVNVLPATILSRCQKIYFGNQHHAESTSWLMSQVTSDDDPELLLKLAYGAPLFAAELARNNYKAIRDALLLHLIQTQQNKINPIAPVTDYLKQDINLLLHAFISLLIDMSRLQLNVDSEFIVNVDCTEQLQEISTILSTIALQRYLIHIQQIKQLLNSSANPNPQLLLEDLLISWQGVRDKSTAKENNVNEGR